MDSKFVEYLCYKSDFEIVSARGLIKPVEKLWDFQFHLHWRGMASNHVRICSELLPFI